MKLQDIRFLLSQTFKEWSEDKAARLAAALSYYTVFSLPPLLIILLAIAGRFFDDAEARVTAQITGFVGETGGEAIAAILENASQPGESIIAIIIGLATLLFGASGVFGQLQEAMNTIWEVPANPKSGILEIVKDRFFSFTMVFGVGFLLLVSLVISAMLGTLDELVRNALPSLVFVAQLINIGVSIGVITILFALIFKVIPDVEVTWRDVWIGALVTAVLFTAGKWGISLYLAKSAPASSYGAAGSLIVILLWIYYSAQILFLGAEFTQVYANKFGSKIVAEWEAGDGITETGEQPSPQERRPVLNVSAAALRSTVSPPTSIAGHHGQTGILPEKLKPLSRLVKRYHHLLVSVLAIPAAITVSSRNSED